MIQVYILHMYYSCVGYIPVTNYYTGISILPCDTWVWNIYFFYHINVNVFNTEYYMYNNSVYPTCTTDVELQV